MKTKLVAAMSALALLMPAHAVLVPTQVGMMGRATVGGPFTSANTLSDFQNERVGYGTGILTGIQVNTPVDFSDLPYNQAFDPFVLWDMVDGDDQYTFTLHSLSSVAVSTPLGLFLNLSGKGFVNGTPADFALSTQRTRNAMVPSSVYVTWSSETTWEAKSDVPEGGGSALLLVVLGVGAAIIIRKLL